MKVRNSEGERDREKGTGTEEGRDEKGREGGRKEKNREEGSAFEQGLRQERTKSTSRGNFNK